MTAFLNILQPGLMTTVQDLGRTGYQSLGIGSSGALDPVALRAANLLVGNDPGEGALEVLYVGPTIEIDVESVRLSFVGTNATMEILSGIQDNIGTCIECQRSVVVKRGEIVKIRSMAGGASLYVGIEGGLAINPILVHRF
jgi:allophanate hydrolase subunit 2